MMTDARLSGAWTLVILTLLLTTENVGYAQSGGNTAIPPPFHQQTSTVSGSQGSGKSGPIQPSDGSKPASDLCSSRVSESMSQTASELLTPKTSSDYVPLSARCKFDLFLRQTYSPYTFASAGFQATLAQATAQWPHYGGGVQGWGKRFGATLADTESRRFIQGFALSTVLHQDPRYFPSNKKRILARIWYAATRVIVVKSDQGRGTFNSAEFLGALFTSSLENAYYPRPDRTFGDTVDRFAGALSSDVTSDILHEFTPDMKRLFRKHAPKEIKKIEKELPIPDDDKP